MLCLWFRVVCGMLYFSVGRLMAVFFFKQKTAYEMRISDWSSDVCSSDLSVFLDAPVVVDDPSADTAWRPQNFEGDLKGPMSLREALVHSRNLEIGRASCRERVCQYV